MGTFIEFFVLLVTLNGIVFAQTPTKLVTSAECGTTKGCFMKPAGCSDVGDCDILITWKQNGNTSVTLEFLGQLEDNDAFVAVGFSKDQAMGDDDVWACLYYGDTVHVEHSYNPSRFNALLTLETGTVTDVASEYAGSAIQCRFTRPLSGSDEYEQETVTYDLTDEHFLLVARGPPRQVNGQTLKSKHSNLPAISSSKITASLIAVDDSVAKRPILLKCHAGLMVGAWLGFASIGIMFASYFKIFWPNSKLCGEKPWFAMHRFFMVMALLCFVGGFVVIFVHVGDFIHYETMDQPIFIHAACGISAVALGLINPFMALCRPTPTASKRPIFNWCHWCVGRSAHILAIACVFIGVNLEMLDLPDYTFWILVGFVCFHALIEIVMKFIVGIAEQGGKRKLMEQYEMKAMDGSRDPIHMKDDDKPSPPGTYAAAVVLSLHIIGVIGIVAALEVNIALL
ncbi:putative ferric-chelate reductase 1 [Glandiceps talaboti]